MNHDKNSSFIWQKRALRYGLAFVAVAAGFWLRVALTAWIGPGLPTYITFYPAVMVAALLAGFGPGLLATVLTGVVVGYWILPPVGQFAIASPIDRVGLVLFAVMGVFMSAVAEFYRRDRRKAAAYDREMALRASQEALRKQVELIDPIRAEIIAREMQRVMLERGGAGAAPVEPTSEMLRRVPVVAGAMVAAVGALVLVGWVFDVAALKSVVPSLTAMKFNTALCFLLAGAALIWRDRRVLRWTFAAVVGLVAAVSLAEYLTGASFGLDQVVIHDPGDLQTVPGRMAQSTALCFILAAISLPLVGARARAALWAQQATALITGTLGLVGLLGYAYEVPQFYGWAGFSSMALHTAVAFTVLGAGLLCTRTTGLVGVLMTPGPGAQLARRLLPAVILVPAITGWLRVHGLRAGLFEPNFGTGMFAITVILIFAALVWYVARTLNRTDMARREIETQLRNLTEVMDNSHEPLIVREIGGVIRAWNRGAEAFYGWPAAEALGQCSHALLRTEGLLAEEHDRRLKTTGHWEGEIVHTTRDGRRVTVESRQTASRVGDGQIFILENNLDITERKRAESARQIILQRFYAVLSSMYSGVLLVTDEGRVEFANQAICDRFGLKDAPADLMNLNSRDMIEKIKNGYLHPDEAVVRIREILDRGQPVRGEEIAMRDGGTCLRDFVPLIVQGKSYGRLWIHFDITERKMAEEQVRNLNTELERRVVERTADLAKANEALCVSAQEFRSLAESMPQIVWATRPDGWNIYFNQQWVDYTGMTMEESHGHGWNTPFHPDDKQRAWEAWQRATQHNERYSLECRLRRADGVYRWWLIRGVPMLGPNGEILKWFGTCTDIEEIKNSEAALKKANDLLEQRVAERTAELRGRERLLQEVIDGSNSPIFLKDRDGKFITINTALEKMMGMSRAEIKGKTDYDIAPKEVADRWRTHDKEVMATGKAIQIEEVADLPDGHHVFLANKFPLVDGADQTYGVGAISHDITERKRVEEALRQSEERYRTMFETMLEGFCIIEVLFDADDRPLDYRFLETNPAFEAQTGLKNARGKRMRELAPEHEAHWFEIYGKVALTGEPARFVNEARALNRWFEVSACRVGGPDSRKVAILFNDITERKRAEEALKKAHTELEVRVEERTAELHAASRYTRSLLEASLDPLVTISPEGKVTDVNQATVFVTGVPREQLIGSNFSDYFTEPDKANEGYQQVIREGLVRDYPLTIRHTSGRTTDVLYHATVYRNEAGAVQGVFAAARDITEYKRAEAELARYRDHLEELVRQRTAELARSNEDLEQFAYVASHDLQEPLRAVGGYVKLLQHRFPEKLDAKAREYVTGAADGAERMQRLIADLLAFSRVGTRGVAFAPADLNALLRDALNNLQTSIKESGTKVTSDPLPSLPVDATQIRQLFQNLIGNAIKFHSEKSPEIHVGARKEKERWLFWVRDNGIGIEPQYAGRIFQIFQRLHSRKQYPGTGIGLAICKKIVERHGGEIRVESEPEHGSTFYFSIPETSAIKAHDL